MFQVLRLKSAKIRFLHRWNDFSKNEGCHALFTDTNMHCVKLHSNRLLRQGAFSRKTFHFTFRQILFRSFFVNTKPVPGSTDGFPGFLLKKIRDFLKTAGSVANAPSVRDFPRNSENFDGPADSGTFSLNSREYKVIHAEYWTAIGWICWMSRETFLYCLIHWVYSSRTPCLLRLVFQGRTIGSQSAYMPSGYTQEKTFMIMVRNNCHNIIYLYIAKLFADPGVVEGGGRGQPH